MKKITTEEFKNMSHQEGLILQGCGGDLQEWIDGINGILREQGILLDGKPLDDVAVFQYEGLTNLLFAFGKHKLDIGKLAIWRIQTREQFGGTWLSDYVENKLGGFSKRQQAKPDCPLIGEDGNIFNLMGIASRAWLNFPASYQTVQHLFSVLGDDHATEKGGFAIDFVRTYYNQSFPDAVTMLLGGEQGQIYRESKPQEQEPAKPFVLPEAHTDMHRVFAYLIKTRCLDHRVVSEFAKAKMLYEDAKYHNAVFVGYDAQGIPRHAHKRGTYTTGDAFKGNVDSCDPRYSFHWIGQSDTVYVFEAPIDMLSFLSFYRQNWKQHSYVALCGVAEHALMRLLTDAPHVNKIALCLDNDKAGVQARERIQKHLAEREYRNVFSLFSNRKDWNEDLQALSKPPPEPAEEQQPVMQMG